MTKQFVLQMIERFLHTMVPGADFPISPDGSSYYMPVNNEDVPDYTLALCAEADGNCLTVRLLPRFGYPEKLRDCIESFVSEWNRKNHWPKAYTDDTRYDEGFEVVLENTFPLLPSIHQELFDHFIISTLAAGENLLRQLACVEVNISHLPDRTET